VGELSAEFLREASLEVTMVSSRWALVFPACGTSPGQILDVGRLDVQPIGMNRLSFDDELEIAAAERNVLLLHLSTIESCHWVLLGNDRANCEQNASTQRKASFKWDGGGVL
jgi:hypothetical protein